jgi:hypothetical protein
MREPFLHLINSVWDCFVHPWPGESYLERIGNACGVLACWFNPELNRESSDA